MLMVNYARALRDLHQTDAAADYAQRGYAKAQQAGAQVVIGQSLLLRSVIYTDMGDLARADAMLDEVEPRLKRGLPSGHIAFASLASDRGLVALERGDLRVALENANEAVAIAEVATKAGRLGGDYLPLFLTRRSEVESRLGHGDLAEADASRALDILQGSGQIGAFSSVRGRAYLALGRALQAQGRAEEARTAFRTAAENLQDALGPDHPDSRSAVQLAQLVAVHQ
jgi:tetratricopeptide (TPR) repeat protein